ncbi:hypothetical protein OAI84_00720 [bacterium]|nr:hypothetical protein [bacterium]
MFTIQELQNLKITVEFYQQNSELIIPQTQIILKKIKDAIQLLQEQETDSKRSYCDKIY